MSFNLKSSLSMAAVAVSALTLAACAKTSGNSTSSDTAQAPVASPEVKAALVETQCPEMIGTYKDVMGAETVYAMASIPGGVSVTTKQQGSEETLLVDGKSHETTKAGKSSTYTASCVSGELKMTATEGSDVTHVSIKIANENGDLQMSVEEVGKQATTFVLTKVTASVETAAPSQDAAADQTPADQSATPAVDPATHSPVDQPAQVPADGPSDPGQAPPLPAESLY